MRAVPDLRETPRYTVAAGLGYKLLARKRAYLSLTNVLLHENTDFAVLNDINVWRNSARLTRRSINLCRLRRMSVRA